MAGPSLVRLPPSMIVPEKVPSTFWVTPSVPAPSLIVPEPSRLPMCWLVPLRSSVEVAPGRLTTVKSGNLLPLFRNTVPPLIAVLPV